MEEKASEWYSEWFNSPFYHILYKHRDQDEAKDFISRLGKFLQFKSDESALDIACGRGRHALHMHQMGLSVDGIDLSSENIAYAKQFESNGLQFYVHDMRKLFRKEKYNYVFNLFTSFGYFDSEQEDIDAIQAFANSLKSGGKLVIDFLNPTLIIKGLVPEEHKEIDGIVFHITRKVRDGFIVKDIQFTHDNVNYCYSEKVQALTQSHFENYFNLAGLSLETVFGNYNLDPFNDQSSTRMIFIVTKK